jgi:O-antigen ligase
VGGDLLFGVGFNAPIATTLVYEPQVDDFVPQEVFAWHNGYLSLLLNVGLLGLSFFSLIAVRIVAGWARIRRAVPTDLFVWAFSTGVGLSLVRILLNGSTESSFTDSFTVPLLAIGIALLERGVVMTVPPNSNWLPGRRRP